MIILIAGGTGRAGRVVAERAVAQGHTVRVLTRRTPEHGPVGAEVVLGDLITGAGLAEALAGVDAVVDASNIATTSYRKSAAFFSTATDRLISAERAAGVGRHLVLSIVGIDDFPGGYYRAKLDQERSAVAAGAAAGVDVTIARVTQFHDFAAMMFDSGRVGPFVLAAPLHLRPVHLDDVADHLIDLLEHPVTGRAPDLSGPRPEELDEMIARYAATRPGRFRVLRLPLPGRFGRANGARHLAPTNGRHGTLTFDDWLAPLTAAVRS